MECGSGFSGTRLLTCPTPHTDQAQGWRLAAKVDVEKRGSSGPCSTSGGLNGYPQFTETDPGTSSPVGVVNVPS